LDPRIRPAEAAARRQTFFGVGPKLGLVLPDQQVISKKRDEKPAARLSPSE
jgi:hypothetical protein